MIFKSRDLSAIIDRKVNIVDSIIGGYMPKEEGPQKTIFEGMNYAISAGGKRLRPILMYETYKLLGGDGEIIKPFMAAIEMIHTYSLVHDDMPCVDNDDMRRGKLTTHMVYGEAMGLFVGDGLLNLAFETIAKGVECVDLSDPKQVESYMNAYRYISRCSGSYGMLAGQVVDKESEDNDSIDIDTIMYLYDKKTGELLRASMVVGAILAGADKSKIDIIEKVSTNVGIAFQIQDDILDVIGSEEELGKPIGSDERNNKSTYVAHYGLEESKEEVRRLTSEALKLLGEIDAKNEFLEEFLISLIDRKK